VRNIKVLFRGSLAEEGELSVAKKYFDVIESRTEVKKGDLVIGRYSVLPYYLELEKDIKNMGGELINSHLQYQVVSDLQNWYYMLEDLTPKTWFQLADVPQDHTGPFILKGATNSRKQLWKTHMFAEDRKSVNDVYFRLMDDTLLQYQGVYIREFIKLKNYGKDKITGCPISKEFRIFVLKCKIVSKGFYWSQFVEEAGNPDPSEIPQDFLDEVVGRIGDACNFYSLDVAQKENGEWCVVELGCGQQSGLSCNDMDVFYGGLKGAI
jgi:hypothetical protein